jgi:carbon-monoxide dehydrogenase large subunit
MRSEIPKFIGARVHRREDPDLVTGRGKYVPDIEAPGAVWMGFVRSPYAHAEVREVDATDALAMPTVVGVYTAEDVLPHVKEPFSVATSAGGGTLKEICNPGRFPITSGRARHVGDAVAIVFATDPYSLGDAIASVRVEYEPLPALVEPEAALENEAPKIHESAKSNEAFVWELESGDVDQAFRDAKHVVELRARIQRLIPNAMEPRAVVARFDGAAGFTLWTSTQIPHIVKDQVSAMLGVEAERVRVIAPEVGGGFGAKANVYGEEVLALLFARHLRRPVRWTATRSEDYLVTNHGRDQSATLWLAADADGRVLGAELQITMDCGAYYSRVTPLIPALTGLMMTGVYDIRNVRARARGVFTNKVLSEPYRGAGRPEAAYYIERGMDVLAREMGIDPAELRRRNFVANDKFPYTTATGFEYDSGNYEGALDAVLEHAGYRELRKEQERRRKEKDRKLLGVGVSTYVEICGFGPFELGSVRVEKDAKVQVLTGTSPHGQGHETSWAQIVAETLQVPIDDIEVLHGDTGIVPKGVGTFGSRSAPVGGAAILSSSESVRESAKDVAAHLLEAAPADVVLQDGAFQVVGVPSRRVSWKDVAALAYSDDAPEEMRDKLHHQTEFEPKGETYPFGAHVAVVEIDGETGEIEVIRFVTVDDCGRVINPLLVEGQVHGGIAQGIGQALWEAARYDESGNLVSGSLMEYAVPRADQLPKYRTNRQETPSPLNALGVKGIGEAATIGSTPAVVNAVVDALAPYGVSHVDTPLTPEKIWRVLRGESSR